MPSHPSSYSPLETLLILQMLTSQTSTPSTFDNISELLKSNKFVRDDPGCDVARFAPDAIRELYLGYMREEVKSRSVATGSGSAQNGYVDGGEEPGSKKRRLESPGIETVEDAEKYRGWLPGLLGQLYARYREDTIREIKEDEGRYRVLEAEVRKLEDEAEEQTRERVNGAASSKPESGPQDTNVLSSTVDCGRSLGRDLVSTKPTQRALSPRLNDDAGRSGVHSDSLSAQPSELTGTPPLAQQLDSSADGSAANEPGAIPNQFPPPSRLPQGNVPYGTPGELPMASPASGTPSYLPQPTQAFPHPSPPRRPPPLQPVQSQSPGQVLDASTTHPFTLPANVNVPPRSPVILPPPPGMPLQSGSPPRPPAVYQDAPGHRRTPSGPTSQQMPYYSPTQQHVTPVPSPAGYPTQAFPPFHGHQQPYSTHVSPYGNQQYSLQPLASRQLLPPSNGPPQDPANIPRHAKGTSQQQQHPPYPNRGTPQGYVTGQAPPYIGTPYGQVQPPGSRGHMYDWTASGRRETPRPPMLDTSFLSTPWKTPDRGYATTDPGSPTRPEDISPISERAGSPLNIVGDKPKTTGKRGRGGRGGRRGGRARKASPKPDTGSRTRRNHRGSTASSAIADSTRSRSGSLISNQNDSHAGTKSHPIRRVKNEPPSTPAGVLIEDGNEADLSAFSKDNTPRTNTRRKPPSALPDTSVRLTSKRKRDALDSADFDDSPPVTSTFPRPSVTRNPNQITTNRNFNRTCQPLMNEVTAHKHASIFAKPLTERDAPGYKELIYRPTDLKTIKSAIHAGTRAIASASSESIGTPGGGDAGSPPSATPGKNTILTLPKTADLIPPKAIVNSAQLERELMRMFANAIMFNPTPTQERGFGPSFPLQRDIDWKRLERPGTTDGATDDDSTTVQSTAPLGYQRFDDGGILNDTREMFDDVEKAVREWRVAEQGTFRGGEEYGGFGSMRGSIASVMGAMSKKKGNMVDRESVLDDSMDELAEEPRDERPGSVVGLGVPGDENLSATGTLTGRKRRRGAE